MAEMCSTTAELGLNEPSHQHATDLNLIYVHSHFHKL